MRSYDSSYVDIVQELANLCSIAAFSFYIKKDYNIEDIRRIISGSIYSNCWVVLEHFSNLEVETTKIICKEILILQQKYILSEINNDNEINRKIVIKNEENHEAHKIQKTSISKEDFSLSNNNNNNSELNSKYLKKYVSIEGENAMINLPEDSDKQIPLINKKINQNNLIRVAHGLFISYYEEKNNLNDLTSIKNEKIKSLKGCFR